MGDLAVPARFRLVRQLGEGGMGIVYEAFDVERSARVALKTVRNVTAESLARFKREFRALQDVSHPNLVSLGELISHDDLWFFTMELVEGDDLLTYVRLHDAPWRDASPADPTVSAGERQLEKGAVASPRASGKWPAPEIKIRPLRSDRVEFDEQRLRACLRQLSSALAAVHAAGLVHRDIKPSNVRVEPGGRVVLLDFGLVMELGTGEPMTGRSIAGTPAYMAPEQATSAAVGAEADWYAMGILLYEALTGALPFDGAPLEIMMRKQREDPPRPSTLVPGVPPDLDDLCASLLRFDPQVRPRTSDILDLVGVARTAEERKQRSHTEQSPFVGRSREMDLLRGALVEVQTDQAVVTVVRGESGVGKSCLVRRFIESVVMEESSTVVFSGRCYEREAVPYKAFDGVVDSLTRFLLRLPEDETTRFLPTRAGLLADLFPVLRRVSGFARSMTVAPQMDPHEARARAFASLRDLLTRIAMVRPVIILIDDLQWADADSLALLTEVMRPPEPPPLLLVATWRANPDDPLELRLEGDVRTIDVTRLSDDEGRELAQLLLERSIPTSGDEAALIAEGAEGHPLFIDALVHYRASAGAKADGAMRLEDALWASVAALEPPARVLVELLAIAGAPVKQEVLVSASGRGRAEEFSKLVSMLRVSHLVSIAGGRTRDAIELYHDRVRTSVLPHLDIETRQRHHRALAMANERMELPDADALALHWRGAGDEKRAATYAEASGDAATRALAFDRAARSYELAIELGVPTGEARRALYVKIGDALASAGRGVQAAAAYKSAAEGAPGALALELQRRSADQLLRGGRFDEGLEALRRVLASIGMTLPATPWLALLSLLIWRLWLRVRGLEFRARDSSQVAPDRLAHVDTCWSVSFGLAMVDNIRGASFQARHLALALSTGERRRVFRALAIEIPYVARGGGKRSRRVNLLIERATALANEIGEPYALGLIATTTALAHHLLGRFRLALEAGDRAESILRECNGVAWELANARMFALFGMVYMGRVRDLCRRQPLYAREAAERGDVYADVQLRVGHPTLRWLVQGDPMGGRSDVEDAMAIWSKRSFQTEHYYELLAHTNIDLYIGDNAGARARLLAHWRALDGSLLMLVQSVRIQAFQSRARAALALAEETGDRGILRDAARDARRVERDVSAAWSTPMAHLLFAGIENVQGNVERARSLLGEAITGFESTDMFLYAAAARRALGSVIAGDEGRALVKEADGWFTFEGVRSPENITLMLAPGFAVRR